MSVLIMANRSTTDGLSTERSRNPYKSKNTASKANARMILTKLSCFNKGSAQSKLGLIPSAKGINAVATLIVIWMGNMVMVHFSANEKVRIE